jgi:hypothetical protein
MHQTTLRFTSDLWSALETEAVRTGVSVAQFVRDAALSRLAFEQGRESGRAEPARARRPLAARRQLSSRIEVQLSSAQAVRAQAQLARDRAKRLREDADRVRVGAGARRG